MAVRNGAPFVGDALSSILAQTFGDLEVIVVDDASTDDTAEEIERVADERVKCVTLDTPSGDLALALDAGVRIASGHLIARMDADDLCYPARLERQVATMRAEPDLVLLGSWVDAVERDGTHKMVSRPPTDDTSIRFILNYRSPYHHPSVIMRRAALEAAGGFRAGYRYAEDYDLWRRLIQHGRAANLPEVLLAQRYHPTSTSGLFRREQDEQSDRIGAEMISHAISRPVGAETVAMLRTQKGSPAVRVKAARTLRALYRSCARCPEFDDRSALRKVAAREMVDLADDVAFSPRGFELWALAARLDIAVTKRRMKDVLRERLRGSR